MSSLTVKILFRVNNFAHLVAVSWKFLKDIIPKGGGAIAKRNGFGAIEFHRLSKIDFLLLLPFRCIPVVSMAISLLLGCAQKPADSISWPPAGWPARAEREKTREDRRTLWTLPSKCKTSSRQGNPQKQRRSQRTEKRIINECGSSYMKPREYWEHVLSVHSSAKRSLWQGTVQFWRHVTQCNIATLCMLLNMAWNL